MSIHRMLSWFPAAWRSRYEAEMRELIEAHPFTWRERGDVLRACVDAWGRELRQRAAIPATFAGALGIRIAVVLLLGWMGVRGLEWLVPNAVAATWWPVITSDRWFATLTVCKLAMFGVAYRAVMRPYEQTRDPLRRPTWLQTFGWVGTLSLLIVCDGRPANMPDVLSLGIFALIRYSPWLQMIHQDGRMRTTIVGWR